MRGQTASVLIWLSGITGVIVALVATARAKYVAEKPTKIPAPVAILVSISLILLAPRDLASPICWIFLAGTWLSVWSSFIIPARADRIFSLRGELGKSTVDPVPLVDIPPVNNLLYIVMLTLQNAQALRNTSDHPPEGYWSVSFPNPMFLGKEYTVRLNFPPINATARAARALTEGQTEGKKDVLLTVTPVAEAFSVHPQKRELPATGARRTRAEFLVTPTRIGKRRLQLEVFIGQTQIGRFQEIVKVYPSVQGLLAIAATVVGLFATLIGLLSKFKGLPWLGGH